MCPVCGLHHSIKHYSPEDLPLDIEAVLKVGLGRGKGTKVIMRYSIIDDDDVTPKIVDRVLTLCRFFLNHNLISTNELMQSLGIENTLSSGMVSAKEYNKQKEEVESLKAENELDRRTARLQSNRADNLLKIVNSQSNELKDKNILIEENEVLKVQAELEGRRADRESDRADSLQETVNSLQGEVSNLKMQLSKVNFSRSKIAKELDEMETQMENSNEVLDESIKEIEDRTDFVFDETCETREDFICSTLLRIFEDLEALKVENEDV